MTSRRDLLAALGGVPLAAAWLPAQAQFRVEIAGVGLRQIPIAIAPFRGEDRVPVAQSTLIRDNLRRSGLFAPIDVVGDYDEADGRLDVRFKVWDVVKGEELLGRSRVVLPADLRLTAHRISDTIYEALTGERGVFATRIAYVTKSGTRYTLNITDADGEGGQVAVTSPEPIISPVWAPDGGALAYVSFETQKAVVWVQEVATGRRQRVADFRGSNSAPAWSPDGQQLAVALSREGLTQLFLVPRQGGAARRLTSSPAIDTEPVFAPDGRSVYFVSDRSGGPQVYRVPVDGGSAERVTFSGSYNISPAISPDGRQMAYVTRQGNAYRVALQDLAGGTVQVLTDTTDDESPSFAPNGRMLLYATRIDRRDVLMTSTLDGRIKTRLITTGGDMREPTWGPFQREAP